MAGESLRPDQLSHAYAKRFTADEVQRKQLFWSVMCRSFLQRFVPIEGTVLDLGAGFCEFSNNIQARVRIAVDLNPDTQAYADSGVIVLQEDSRSIRGVDSDSVDTVFTSNFFEHLPNSTALLQTLEECHRVLRPGGLLVVLMPNIRNLPGAYWDYLDHHLALTHVSLAEALVMSGFKIERVEPRFIPYTIRNSRFPIRPWLVRLYLRFRPAWRLFGKQMFVVAVRDSASREA